MSAPTDAAGNRTQRHDALKGSAPSGCRQIAHFRVPGQRAFFFFGFGFEGVSAAVQKAAVPRLAAAVA
jgi:hypothetical protein